MSGQVGVGVSIELVCPRSTLDPTNRATGRVCNHSTGLAPSSALTGEDLASMMPDRRHALSQRAVSMRVTVALRGSR